MEKKRGETSRPLVFDQRVSRSTFYVPIRHNLAACCRSALSAPTARTGMYRRVPTCVPSQHPVYPDRSSRGAPSAPYTSHRYKLSCGRTQYAPTIPSQFRRQLQECGSRSQCAAARTSHQTAAASSNNLCRGALSAPTARTLNQKRADSRAPPGK